MEKITHEAGNEEAWICKCGNMPPDDGFDPCDENGEQMEPVEGWNGFYRCVRCGAIINQATLEIVGYNREAVVG